MLTRRFKSLLGERGTADCKDRRLCYQAMICCPGYSNSNVRNWFSPRLYIKADTGKIQHKIFRMSEVLQAVHPTDEGKCVHFGQQDSFWPNWWGQLICPLLAVPHSFLSFHALTGPFISAVHPSNIHLHPPVKFLLIMSMPWNRLPCDVIETALHSTYKATEYKDNDVEVMYRPDYDRDESIWGVQSYVWSSLQLSQIVP